MTKTIDYNMNQDTSTTTAMNKTTTRKRRAACDDNDNDSSNNHTSTGSLSNLTPNATNNEENSHQPFKRPRLPSPFTRQAERFEEALNREIEEQEDALRMNEYRMLAVRALENEAHDRAFRDAMDVSSTYQQQQQYTSTQNPSVAAAATAVDEDMDMDVDGDDYHNSQLEDPNGNGEGEEGQMVTPTVQETTQPTIPTQSGCLTSSLIGLDSNNNFTPIPISYPIPTPRTRPSNNNHTNNSSNLDFTIFEDIIIPDRGGLLSFSPRPNRVASMLPGYLHYPYTNNNHHHNDNQEVVDRSFHDHYDADADADEDEMRLDYDEGSPAAGGGGGGESGRWGSGVPTWRVESESEYADTEVDPDDMGLGVHDYANRRRRRYHRLRWQSRVLGSPDRGSVALNSSNVLVPRMLGEGVQGDGAGGVAGRGRRGPRRL